MLRRELLAGLLMAIRRDRIEQAETLIRRFTDTGEVAAAALLVRQGRFDLMRGFGKAAPDTVFLLASITKPMTAAGVMILRDRHQLTLEAPVRKFIPEFTGGDRDLITIRHLLTHTSGLPDMLPENVELRKRHAPLREFIERTYKTPLVFKPGTQVRYQSMGILLASDVVERIVRMPFREFLKKELFEPLGMKQTSLGLGGRRIADTAQCQVGEKTDWDWNSPYWRDLGAPWGGAHSNVADVATFLSSASQEMITNQNRHLKEPWGLGWMLKPGTFGHSCSPATYGHYGSTGTVAWRDPATKTSCVLLTTKPAADSRNGLLGPVSDLVSDSAKQ